MTSTDKGTRNFKRIKPVFIKEVLHIVRDTRSLAIALLAPVVLLVLYAYAVTFDIKRIDLGVVDYDDTAMSRELTAKFTANGYFELHRASMNSMEACVEALRINKIKMIIVIPPGMSSDVKSSKTVQIQAIGDGSDTNTVSIGLGYANATIAQFSRSLLLAQVRSRGINPKSMPVIEPVPRVWYNPDLKSINFIVPGLSAIIMMLISALLTSLTVVREREQNTFEQLVSTPLKPLELMIGKLVTYIVLCLVDVAIIVAVSIVWFKVPFRGSVLTLTVFTVLFLFCALGLGMIISSSVKSQQMAVIGTAMGTLLPSILLSGFVFPIDSMPAIIRGISYVVPARYFITALRTIFLKADADIASLWVEALYLFVFGMFFLIASARRFRKDLE
ncbi:MAG: ABC transporter permease [Spirochaetia bacterium]|nr:ABC transporter permease [Spirochaetia bacterium]